MSGLGDPAVGTTVTPTASRAGTTTNTVPAEGSFAVDVRVRTVAEQDRVDAAMRALRPVLPGAVVEVARRPQPAAARARRPRPRSSSGPAPWPRGSA